MTTKAYRDPNTLPDLLRKFAERACPVPKAPPFFGAREEYRDILEHAADELERLQSATTHPSANAAHN